MADQAKEYREKLVEAAAETDDDLLNKYLEEGSLGEAEMLKALRAGIAAGKLVPVLAAAAPRRSGPPRCSICWSSPSSPLDRGEVSGTDLKTKQEANRAPDPKAR